MRKYFLLLLLSFFAFTDLQAQGLQNKTKPRAVIREYEEIEADETAGKLEKLKTKRESQFPAITTPLEHPVDENEYYVGPGDIFDIIIGNRMETTFQTKINPEGIVILPDIGSVDVKGLLLRDAKKIIIDKIKTTFLDDQVSVLLSDVRSFKVTVSGAVFNPGLVIVKAMDRVTDAILLSGGFFKVNEQALAAEKLQPTDIGPVIKNTIPIEIIAKRNVQIKHRDGTVENADLLNYELTGDLSANPVLQDGDVITIPKVTQIDGKIIISGYVQAPAEFEYVPGDRLKTILAMAQGFTQDADSSKIEIVRFSENNTRTQHITLFLDTPQKRKESLNFSLQPNDRILIQRNPAYTQKPLVEISGEVKFPNKYTLDDSLKTLSQLVKRAGGFTRQASINNAYVIRRPLEAIEDMDFLRLQETTISEMTQKERDYFKTKYRERKGKLNVDFEALFLNNDSTEDILLHNLDFVYVPTYQPNVNVAGQVVFPGWQPFVEGQKKNNYIALAGGYNFNAHKSKTRIIKGRTGEWVKPDDTVIEAGDTIYIPEKKDRNYMALVRDVVVIAAQIVTVVIVLSAN